MDHTHPDSLTRKLARQNAAELADGTPAEHIAAFAASARRYSTRLPAVWDLPHHQYRDIVVTVGGMAGVACAERHLHASDLAAAIGAEYRPADPDIILEGWAAGMPHVPPMVQAGRLAAWHSRHADPWQAVMAASGRCTVLAASGRGTVPATARRSDSPAPFGRRATLPSADREPGGDRSWARWTARPLLRRKG